MTETIEIPSDESQDLAYGYTFDEDEDSAYAGWKFVREIEGDRSRWTYFTHAIIQDPQGRYWGLTYERGATEYQDYNSLRNGEPKTWTRMYPRQVTTTEYTPDPTSATD